MTFILEACIFVLACTAGLRVMRLAKKEINKFFDRIEKKL